MLYLCLSIKKNLGCCEPALQTRSYKTAHDITVHGTSQCTWPYHISWWKTLGDGICWLLELTNIGCIIDTCSASLKGTLRQVMKCGPHSGVLHGNYILCCITAAVSIRKDWNVALLLAELALDIKEIIEPLLCGKCCIICELLYLVNPYR